METEYAVISNGRVINMFHSFRNREDVQWYYPNCAVVPVSEAPAQLLHAWHNRRSA